MMDGKALAQKLRDALVPEVQALGHVGIATMLVGDDPASHIYIEMKHKAATAAGFEARDVRLSASATQDEVLATLAELNADDTVDGILVQLPLPAQVDETTVLHAISPMKDVDGLHPDQRGPPVSRHATAHPGDAVGLHRAAARVRDRSEGQERGRHRSQRARRTPSGDAAPAASTRP